MSNSLKDTNQTERFRKGGQREGKGDGQRERRRWRVNSPEKRQVDRWIRGEDDGDVSAVIKEGMKVKVEKMENGRDQGGDLQRDSRS